MAERFARGGRLIAIGAGGAARSDVRHVTVEFVHPVIVGKRALPALGLSAEGGDLAAQARLVVEADDIAIAFGDGPEVAAAVAVRAGRGALSIAFADVGAEWAFALPGEDPFVAQEIVGDDLPRALGARARLPRAPRAARGAHRRGGPRRRRLELPVPVPRPSARTTSRRSSPTYARRCA